MIDIKLYAAMFNNDRTARSTYTAPSRYMRTHATYKTSDGKEFHLHYWGQTNGNPRPGTITFTCDEFVWSRRVYIHTMARSMGFLLNFADELEDTPDTAGSQFGSQTDFSRSVKLAMADGRVNVSEMLGEDWSLVINDNYSSEDVENIMVRLVLETVIEEDN